jgi:hypothetical protein
MHDSALLPFGRLDAREGPHRVQLRAADGDVSREGS